MALQLFTAAVVASTMQGVFVIWILCLMAAVLGAGVIYLALVQILKLIDHWRFLFWLNQLHR